MKSVTELKAVPTSHLNGKTKAKCSVGVELSSALGSHTGGDFAGVFQRLRQDIPWGKAQIVEAAGVGFKLVFRP